MRSSIRPPESPLCIFCSLIPQWHPRPLLKAYASFSTSAQLLRERSSRERTPDGFRLRRVITKPVVGTKDFTLLGSTKSVSKSLAFSVREAFKALKTDFEEELETSNQLRELKLDEESFAPTFEAFESHISGKLQRAATDGPMRDDFAIRLQRIYIERGERGLKEQLRLAFYGHVIGKRFTPADINNQKRLADLRYPSEWFPAARTRQRTIHLHVGPTNSGKTYHALKRLEEVGSGIYAGPLRLLAHEVYSRFSAKGMRCALITGEEKRLAEPYNEPQAISACTVEMVPMNSDVPVAVIDEIQMIGDSFRGWAWSQALFGLQARELHLCGEERAVPLVQDLAARMGDQLKIHHYQRLSPLQMAKRSIDGEFQNLEKGDCVVSFSVMGLHALKKDIEKATGKKCAIVYGSLPPETRAAQARLFNDPNNDYDFLVASDAIGMGLNLSIKRIIFETASKFNGVFRVPLSVSEVRQIGGRAGRYRTAEQAAQPDVPGEPQKQSPNVGLVTTLVPFDFLFIAKAMESEPEPLLTAGLLPPATIVERFSSYFPPGTPFSYVLLRLHEIAQTHHRFHLCNLRDQLRVADIIQPVKDLTVSDRLIFCAAPMGSYAKSMNHFMRECAEVVAAQGGGGLLDLKWLNLEILDEQPRGSREYLKELEELHKKLVLYLWLSYRFVGVFDTRNLAMYAKQLTEEAIEKALAQFSWDRAKRQRDIERHMKESLQRQKVLEEQTRLEQAMQANSDQPFVGLQEQAEPVDEPEEAVEILRDDRSLHLGEVRRNDDYDEYEEDEDLEEDDHSDSEKCAELTRPASIAVSPNKSGPIPEGLKPSTDP